MRDFFQEVEKRRNFEIGKIADKMTMKRRILLREAEDKQEKC
jgi:hypothetical protein